MEPIFFSVGLILKLLSFGCSLGSPEPSFLSAFERGRGGGGGISRKRQFSMVTVFRFRIGSIITWLRHGVNGGKYLSRGRKSSRFGS